MTGHEIPAPGGRARPDGSPQSRHRQSDADLSRASLRQARLLLASQLLFRRSWDAPSPAGAPNQPSMAGAPTRASHRPPPVSHDSLIRSDMYTPASTSSAIA